MDGSGIALAFGFLFFGNAIFAWALILATLGLGLWFALRRRGGTRAIGALFVFLALSVAVLIVLRPELDDHEAAQRLQQQRAGRIQPPKPLPRTLVIETDIDLEPDWRDIVLEVAESEAFDDVVSRSPTRDDHVEMIESDDCLISRLKTPKYVAANGFLRCGRLVTGAEHPDTYLLLQVGAPGASWKGNGVEATLRLFLVDGGSKALIEYGEVWARMKRDFMHRVFMIPGPRVSWYPESHRCRVRRIRRPIDLPGFLLGAIGQEIIPQTEFTLSAAELLARAESILASHHPPSEAAAAGWAIFTVMPAGSEKTALGRRLVEFSAEHDDDLISTRLPFGSHQARDCVKSGMEL